MHFRPRMMAVLAAGTACALLAGCSGKGELVVDEGVGITAVRSTCPAVGIANATGDMTTFRVPGSSDAKDIDLVAAITDVRPECDEKSNPVKSHVTFKVQVRRSDTHGARDVTLPYFFTVMRGGRVVIAKSLGSATVHFADGQDRAETTADGTATIDKKEATLDRAIHDRIVRPRKSGEADAAIDPLADPAVLAAVNKATFEVLVGFQLSDAQLGYNATR
ncbi:hypothetical protein [Novosphingobium rosa]|uniref:hypothetical protein n=1 Tax=Novosphingobium rosa TaxID=76978 RepID=UPI00082A03BE|nr:hypothetical protein [Novosphingobium rosa]